MPVDVCPERTVDGDKATAMTGMGRKIKLREPTDVPSLAVTVPVVLAATAAEESAKVAEAAPSATTTDAGTVA